MPIKKVKSANLHKRKNENTSFNINSKEFKNALQNELLKLKNAGANKYENKVIEKLIDNREDVVKIQDNQYEKDIPINKEQKLNTVVKSKNKKSIFEV